MCRGNRSRREPRGAVRDDVRVGDEERAAALERLAAHYAAGRLRDDELEERSARAAAARTAGELRALEGDLPRLPRPVGERRRARLYANAWHLTWAIPTGLSIML